MGKELNKWVVIDTHISEIKHGDTVLCTDNIIRTVSREYIKKDCFMGITLYGDSYNLGTKPVKKMVFVKSEED